jgi:hypothetical protein
MMRTLPAFLLCLLAPLVALAQPLLGAAPESLVSRSPLIWYWMAVLVVAVGAFIWVALSLSRRRGGPPSGPRIS